MINNGKRQLSTNLLIAPYVYVCVIIIPEKNPNIKIQIFINNVLKTPSIYLSNDFIGHPLSTITYYLVRRHLLIVCYDMI
jgi:hypothetical protein